jgi:TusA-related sulfurtransferase
MADDKPDQTLDCIGLFCPVPVYETRITMDKMAIGEILEVLADDPAAEEDIKRWTQTTGQNLLEFTKDGNRLRFLIKKVR